jgi:hypothetical protein
VIESEFENSEGTEAVGFSHGDFSFVVEALDNAAGELFLSPEVVQDEFAVLAQGSCDFLYRLDLGTHDLAAPEVEKLTGPGG